MKSRSLKYLIIILLLSACQKEKQEETSFFSNYNHRNFEMGFTTWPYARTVQAVDDTYSFLTDNADVYAEHIDSFIPWSAWMNNTALPTDFVNNIQSKANRKIAGNKLLLSIGLLSHSRDELMQDVDGSTPIYTHLNDAHIVDAYYKHVHYLVNALQPDRLVIAIEVNKLLLVSTTKWNEYKLMIAEVKTRIKNDYPNLPISESMMLHVLLDAQLYNLDTYINEIFAYTNQLDFTSISFYPFMNNLHTKTDFQSAFDFLHQRATNTIAFVETGNISKNLVIPNLNVDISGSEAEQQVYLETLCVNVQEHSYDFIIWWTHRDYTALWQTFPPEVKDLGSTWLSTGLVRDNGTKRPSYTSWQKAFEK